MPTFSKLRRASVVIAALQLASLLFLPRLSWVSELRGRFLPEDPAGAALARESALFGAGDHVAILVEARHAFEDTTLVEQTRRWQAQLRSIPQIADVITFLDLPTVVWDETDAWHTEPIGAAKHPLQEAAGHPLARKGFFRRDGNGMLLFVKLEPGSADLVPDLRGIRDQLRTWIAKTSGPYQLTLAGGLRFFHLTSIEEAARDVAVLSLPILLACFVILTYAFSAGHAALIIGLGILNIASTLGLAGLMGWHLSQFSTIAVPVVFVTSLLDNVHIAFVHRRRRHAGDDPAAVAEATFARLFMPCLWTSLTTAAGFGALIFSTIPSVRQFGCLCVAGSVWALLSSFALLLPSLGALRGSLAPKRDRARFLTERAASAGRPRWIVALAATLVLVSLPGLSRLRFRADFPRLFGNDHPTTRLLDRIEREWTGIATVSYLLEPRPGVTWTDPEVVSRLRDFVGLLGSRELITAVSSPVDLIALGRQSFVRRFGRLPSREESSRLIDGLLRAPISATQRSALAEWIDPSSRTLRIVARMRMMQPELFPKLARDLEGFRANLDDLFQVHLGGWPLLYKNLERRMLDELVRGFLVAFVAVAVLLLIALRSPTWWLLALLVNLAPLAIALGALGWLGRGFSSQLIVAPAVALGLIVDDTIHFLLAAKTSRRLSTAVSDTGTPITITSAVLAVGFSAMFFSVFRGNQWLAGVLTAIVILAWAADVVVLPALLQIAGRESSRG